MNAAQDVKRAPAEIERGPRLRMRRFVVQVAVVPPVLEQKLFGVKIEYQNRAIYGYTLADAKRRNRIN